MIALPPTICYTFCMTKLLEQAIQRLRQLPADRAGQRGARSYFAAGEEPEPGDCEAIEEGRKEFRHGAIS